MSSTGACFAKVVLGILNTLFLIIGLGLVAVGSIIVAGADFFADILKSFKDLPVISDYLNTAAWILIGIGIFFLVMGILGGCGACCSIKVFLIAYAVIVIVLIIAEVTFVALLFSDKLKDLLSDSLTSELKSYKPIYSGGTIDKDVKSRAMDLMFIELKCCGWNNYKDIDPTNPPITCCSSFSKSLLEVPDSTKLSAVTSCTSLKAYNKGCYQAILDLIDDNKAMVIGVGVALLVFQILCVLFAIWIVRDAGKVSPID